jgi:hypothetical protein
MLKNSWIPSCTFCYKYCSALAAEKAFLKEVTRRKYKYEKTEDFTYELFWASQWCDPLIYKVICDEV